MAGAIGERTQVPRTLGLKTPLPRPSLASSSGQSSTPSPIIPGQSRTPGPNVPAQSRTSAPTRTPDQSRTPGQPGASAAPGQPGASAAPGPRRCYFTWQEINSDQFYLKGIHFMTLNVIEEQLRSGSTSHMLPAVTISRSKEPVTQPDAKKLTTKEILFQSVLLNATTFHFLHALLRQCIADPSLAEYIWFALFQQSVSGYEGSEKVLLDRIFKNQELPANAEKALRMIKISADVFQSFTRGPNYSNFLTLELEKNVFQMKEPKVSDIEQVCSLYFNINAQDLLYGLYHVYLPETSVAFAYEKAGHFFEASKEYVRVLMSNSVENYPKYQKFVSETGFKRCVDKLARWDSISKQKFVSCEGVFKSRKSVPTCKCPHEENIDNLVAFRQMYFLLCPANVHRDRTRPRSQISEALSSRQRFINFELKRIPRVLAPGFRHQLQKAARVFEFETSHTILRSLFDVRSITERSSIFRREYWQRRVVGDLELWDDVHGARLRTFSLFRLNRQCLAEERTWALKLYNDFYLKVASEAFEQGNVESCLKHLKNVQHMLSRELLELRTELIVRTINTIQDASDRDDYLKMAFDHFQTRFDGSIGDLQWQAKFYAYMGLLKSLPGSEWTEEVCRKSLIRLKDSAGSLFEESLRLSSFSKNHEWYGNFLEKTFTAEPFEGRLVKLGVAKEAILQFICSCKYKNKFEAQVPLAKVLGLLLYGEEELESALVENYSCIKSEYWLPLLPQLLESGKQLHLLLEEIGSAFPQDLYFAFRELRAKLHSYPLSFSEEFVRTISRIKMENCKLLFTLEKIGDELFRLNEAFCDDTLNRLTEIKTSVVNHAYECSVRCAVDPQSLHLRNILEATLHKHLQGEIEKILRLKENLDRPLIKKLEATYNSARRGETRSNVWKLLRKLLLSLTKIMETWEKSKNVQVVSLFNYSRFLSTFHLQELRVEIFRNWNFNRESDVHIVRFLPRLEILQRHGTYTCRIRLLGNDGQEYSYLVVPVSRLSQNEHRVNQLFFFLNQLLAPDKKLPRFTIPSIVPFPEICLAEDDEKFQSYLRIYKSHHQKVQYDVLVVHYTLLEHNRSLENGNVEEDSDENIKCTIFNEVQLLVPNTILTEWVMRNCRNSADFILFRKKFSTDMALLAFSKYCFRLCLQTPDNLLINKRTGVLASFGLKFEPRPKLRDSQRIVAERGHCTWPTLQLTPNMLEFLNLSGMHGSVVLTMAATACCFNTNIDGINAMLNVFIFKELEEREKIENPKFTGAINGAIFQETRRHIREIDGMIKGCAVFGNYEGLHTLVSESYQVKNMSLSNPLTYPWY